MRVLSLQEATDILVGCTILGTGGGGELKLGLDAIELCYEQDKHVKLLDLNEVKSDSYYVTTGLTGPVSEDCMQPVEIEIKMMSDAVRALEKYLRVEFDGLVSTEYGGGSTGESMAVSAMLGKYYVDCDAAGRAVPMMQHSTYNIVGQPAYPFATTTKYGDEIIVTNVQSDERFEDIVRAVAVASGNLAGVADHSITGSKLKSSVIPSALSYAEKVGKAQREANLNNVDPVKAIVTAGDGYLLFRGIVGSGTDWETDKGFTFGEVCIDGIADFHGQSFKLWYQNEHMISWKNNEVYVTCPDLLCVVNNRNGYPITNPNCNIGDEIAVLGFKTNEFWRTNKGFAMLNPRFFNQDIDHIPIEDLLQ